MKQRNFVSRFDIYRIVDPIFRVHTRLFHLQFVFSRLLKILSGTGVSINIALTGLFVALISLFRSYFKLEWTSAPVITSVIVASLLFILFVSNLVDVWMARKESKRLIGDAFIEEDIESWAEYTKYVIAAFGTRLKIIKEAQEENEYLYEKNKRSEEEFKRNKELFDEITKHAKNRIEFYKRKNEEFRKSSKRSDEEYKEINHWIEIALK